MSVGGVHFKNKKVSNVASKDLQIVQTFDKPMLDDSKKKTFIHHVQLLIGENEN